MALHAGNAFWAAWIAAWASSFCPLGYSATVSRVSAGLELRKVWPGRAATQSPPMKWEYLRMEKFTPDA